MKAKQDRNGDILRALQRHPMAAADAAREIGISPKLARRALAELRTAGLVERVGQSRNALWMTVHGSDNELPADDQRDAGFMHRLIPSGQWAVSVPVGAVTSVFDLGAR